jgi:hypothetical protein
MADLLTTIRAVTTTAAELAYAANAPGDVAGMLAEAQERMGDLFMALRSLLTAFPIASDPVQTTINGLCLTVQATGQLNFSLPQNSGQVLTIKVFA